jgi:type II secretory pathway pseudopilin PulG
MEWTWLRIVQALAILGIAGNVSLVLLATNLGRSRDQVRAGNAKLLMAALEKYRSSKGAYPVLLDKPITDLKSTLVDGGFLKEIPPDLRDAQPMRYVSHIGTSYGMLSTKNRKRCLIEVGVSNTGWWGLTSENLCSYD